MKQLIGTVVVLALAGALCAQEQEKEKKPARHAASHAGGVLHPEMKPAADAGSFDKPMGTMGEKAQEPWTSTTVSAGVNGKPQPGKPLTAVGEIIDMSCYLQLGKHGEKHVSCGKKCLQANEPVGLLTNDGAVYMLMEEEHDPRRDGQTSAFRKAAIDHFGHVMEVSGTEASHGGFKAIYVQGYVKK